MTPRRRLPEMTEAAITVALAWAIALGVLLWSTRGCEGSPMPPALTVLADRIEADPDAPAWKRALVPKIRSRKIGRFTATVTMYCPDNSIDPLGGGPNAAWGGLKLRKGHCAVGTRTRAVPLGTVLFCPAVVDHLLVAVDTGPGVNGLDRLDLCLPSPREYLAADRHNWRRYPCWRLGRITKEQAR